MQGAAGLAELPRGGDRRRIGQEGQSVAGQKEWATRCAQRARALWLDRPREGCWRSGLLLGSEPACTSRGLGHRLHI